MRALLDTNIIIHRENNRITNKSIGELYYWLDKLNYEKVIHPYTISEIEKFAVDEIKSVLHVKLKSYVVLKTALNIDKEFIDKIAHLNTKENDYVDNSLLYELYRGRVDLLITEDRKIQRKAKCLGIEDKVFSIDRFLSKCLEENPKLRSYKMLSVQKKLFSEVDLDDTFFDSLKSDYPGFEKWFLKKYDEEAYVCSLDDSIYGFLYIKVEDEREVYSDINPVFKPMKRLKVGTFKVESTGFRLGERFIKIIFDNALQYNVDEIYITLFNDRIELNLLKDLLLSWGFFVYGTKKTDNKENREELVMVKKMNQYDSSKTVKENFPMLNLSVNKFIHPIYPPYHTDLFPDSILYTEKKDNYLDNKAHRYSLEKIYVQWMPLNDAKPGDLILFYRTGEQGTRKRYTSTITTLGVLEEIKDNFKNFQEFLNYCENRSVFSHQKLEELWNSHNDDLKTIKFIYVKSLEKRPILNDLYNLAIVPSGKGPRSFTIINDDQFYKLLEIGNTKIKEGRVIENV